MTDGYFGFSSAVYPLESLTADPTPVIKIGDPVLYAVASAFAQFLNTNLAPRFFNEAAACRMTHANLDNWVDNTVVAQIIDYPLDPQALRVTNYKFPLMSVYVEEEHFHQYTLVYNSVRRDIVIAWILPPMAPEQMNRMYEFFGIASKTWLAYGPQGYDPKVTPSGPSFWTNCNLSFGMMNGVKYLPYLGLNKDKTNAYFPSIQMRISFVERNQYPVPQNYETFTGISTLQENLVDGYNPANPIVDFIDGYIQPDITLTSCTPNTGSVQGNTLVVIQGTGFDVAKLNVVNPLVICGAPVAQLVVRSPTVIMAVTNPSPGVGVGNIVLTDFQGNTYTLGNGFTYTLP